MAELSNKAVYTAPKPIGPMVKAIQIVLAFLYGLFCLVHTGSMLWLFVIPRYMRERFALWLLVIPWSVYTGWLLRPRIRVVGAEHLPLAYKGFVYTANHESFVDILLLGTIVRRAFLMKKSVLYTPIGWGAYLAGSVGVERASKIARQRALRQTLFMASSSLSMIVFPEGTFGHRDGTLREPKLNLLKGAYDYVLPVIPLGHAGTRRALNGQSLPVRTNIDMVLVVRPLVDPKKYADRNAFAKACWKETAKAVEMARAQVAPGWPYENPLNAKG